MNRQFLVLYNFSFITYVIIVRQNCKQKYECISAHYKPNTPLIFSQGLNKKDK